MTAYALYSIEGNRQRLDGGAMYGNVPRALWAEWSHPDELNRIELACRAFLIHDLAQNRRVLLEAGVGVFFHPKMQERFGVTECEHKLLLGLTELGVEPESIDVVVLSHLHFDHAGGLLTPWRADGSYELVFPRARYVISRRAWERARAPHFRDRASFIPELNRLLEATGKLELVEGERSAVLGPDFSFTICDGHTPGLLLTRLATSSGAVIFCGDLIPGCPWIHLPITMGYDRYAELVIDEKQRFLTRCIEEKTRLLFTHDPGCAMCAVALDDRGRFVPRDEVPALREFKL
jgi:glyoxylase-like metal-dependent hydrolase (beta-lactamase superfamily II)